MVNGCTIKAFRKGHIDINLYIKVEHGNMIVVKVYVDDITFGRNDNGISQQFSMNMQKEFEMSMLIELSFFLGLHISQLNNGIFISQTKYVKEMLKILNMEYCKPVCTPKIT